MPYKEVSKGLPKGMYEHRLIAERALGHSLPDNAIVHHVNNDGRDNSPGNLVICQDHQYHMELHRRARAKEACGFPGWVMCTYCKEYGDPKSSKIGSYKKPPGRGGSVFYHKACASKRTRALYRRQNPDRVIRKYNRKTPLE